jgi:UDP:flavonoid glycosyltransferase YjiC (YdhE family)
MKFVVAGYGSRGDVEPCIAVARELLRRGHDVRMAVTVPPDMLAFVESAGLTVVPYGRDYQELLGDKDFVRMLQNPINAISEAIEYVAQVSAEKSTTLTSLTDGADLLVAGITEQTLAANVAEYYGIPLAALHFFRRRFWSSGSRMGAQRRRRSVPNVGHSAYRRHPHSRHNLWRSRLTTSCAFPGWRPNGRSRAADGRSSGR